MTTESMDPQLDAAIPAPDDDRRAIAPHRSAAHRWPEPWRPSPLPTGAPRRDDRRHRRVVTSPDPATAANRAPPRPGAIAAEGRPEPPGGCAPRSPADRFPKAAVGRRRRGAGEQETGPGGRCRLDGDARLQVGLLLLCLALSALVWAVLPSFVAPDW